MREIDFVLQKKTIRRHHADELLAIDHFDRLAKAEQRHFCSELSDASGIDEVHERKCAAIDDRYFRTVDVNIDVGDSAGHQRGKEMLDGSDRHVISANG